MYSYTYDSNTGGILLNLTPTVFSKEPRPVYSTELDILGFDKYWKYDKQTDFPYMWAEANNYYYYGQLVASLSGGNIYEAPIIQFVFECKEFLDSTKRKKTEKIICTTPERLPSFEDENGNVFTVVKPEPSEKELKPIDIKAMVKANYEILNIIEQTTVKKILDVYTKYTDKKNKLDCFHVAFSGGKDSCVLLDLVKKALPKDSFVVVFGDTGMEFPDTYDVIEKIKQQCLEEKIPFYTAKSHLETKQSWEMFGPPSRVLRWCCSVHKSTPQTLKLREITGKNNYTGLAFVGVRSYESASRSEYDYLNDGKKIKGQLSHNSILEWTSAEIWLYIFTNNILINEAYKKGNSRIGCLLCPMTVNKSDFIKYKIYTSEMSEYINIINKLNCRDFGENTYITNGGWVSRRSGRDLINSIKNYTEIIKYGKLQITIPSLRTDWREWVKTVFNFEEIQYKINPKSNGYVVQLNEEYVKEKPVVGKYFKQVFRKATYCVGCRVCEANCTTGCLKFFDKFKITGCKNCMKCYDVQDGCLVYNSLRITKEERTMSINSYDTTLPKSDWFNQYLENKNNFWESNELGPNQIKTFKTFLRHTGLMINNEYSPLANIIKDLGWETETSWGILLINLATESPQFQWYINNMELNRIYPRETILSMLLESNSSKNVVKNVYSAYSKLIELPLGTVLHWGHVTDDGELVRTKCSVNDQRVILYGLYKFAEKCNNYKEFTLATLLNDSIDRDGISPTRIFGFDREEMMPYLLGLSAKYPEYITASFTHDLEKITLAENKTSIDVLDLFKEELNA